MGRDRDHDGESHERAADDRQRHQDLGEGHATLAVQEYRPRGARHWMRNRPLVAMITLSVSPPEGLVTRSVPLAAQGEGVAAPAPSALKHRVGLPPTRS